MKNRFLMSALMVLLVSSISLAQETALSSVDSDGDGKVTTKEFKSYAETRLRDFDRLDDFVKKVDADGNGEISEGEFANRRTVLAAMANSAAEPQEGDDKKAADKEMAEEATGPHKVGDKASDFELQSIGKTIRLSDNFGDDGKPVIVVFSRANW